LRPPVRTRAVARRLWWIRPRSVLIAVGAAILGWFVLDRSWIRGNGIVAGELTAESPIVKARLERLFVKCLDHVSKGQRLAEFYNEAMVQLAGQELQQLQFQLAQARAEIEIADREAQAAQKLTDAQNALLQQQVAVLEAESKLKEQKFVADLVWQQAKAAVDRADAETRAAQFVYETKRADQKIAEVSVDVLQKRINSYVNSPELTGHFYLAAAKEGIVTECTAREGEVIAARTPILSIFNPKDTYAVVFFDPSDRSKLFRGQVFDVTAQGMANGITATLTDFYPELSALPSSLTRFFWQKEMWSQFVPTRLEFANLDPEQLSRIFAWSQISASRRADWGLPDLTQLSSDWWHGLQQYVGLDQRREPKTLANRDVVQ
jgi:multidrug resistance efflux pump